MPVAADDVVWLDVLPSMGRFRQELQTQAGTSAQAAGSDSGGKFSGAFTKALKIGAAVGGALAVAGAANFLKEATREASDLGESLNAVQVTFGESAEGINRLGRAAAESVGLSQSQFNGLAVQFSAFATSIAGEGGDVVGVMKDLTTRGADFASVMNLDVNEAMGLFQSGLAGETEPLRKYGIDLSAAAVENYALANGIVKAGEEMTEAQKVQARYGSLMEQTSKVQGDFTNTSDSLANSQRILGARWDDIQAMVGMKVIPTLEKFSGWVVRDGLPAIMGFGGWIRDNLGPIFSNLASFFTDTVLPTLRDLSDAVLPALGTAFQVVGDVVSATVGFFQDHEGAAKALGITVGVIAGLVAAAWVAQATVSTINAAKSVAAWFATATASTTSATIQSRSTAQIVVGWLAASASAVVNGAKIVAAWAVSVAQTGVLMAMYAAQSVAAAARSAAAWVAAQIRTVASLAVTAAGFVAQGAVMLASMAVTAAGVVAGWVMMGVQSLIRAAQMAAAWLIAMGPIAIVIAAVVALVALIIANWDTVKRVTIEVWNAVWGFIKDVATAIWNWVTTTFTNLKNGVVAIFGALRDAALAVWTFFRDAIITAAKFIWDTVVAYFNFWKAAVTLIFTTVRDVVVGIWNGFRDLIVAVALFIWNSVVNAFNRLRDGVVAIYTGIRDTVVGIWNAFRDLLVNGAQTIWNFVRDKFNGMKDAVVGIFQTIKDTVGRVWDGLVDAVKTPIRVVFQFVNDKMIGPVNTLLDKFPGGLRIPPLPVGFRKGGYTGDGNPDEVAGAVHKREYVFTAEQVDRIGLGKLRSLAASATGRDIGGPGDWWEATKGAAGDAWNATGGKVVTAVGDAAGWVKDMAIEGARKVAERILNPLANAAKRMTPDNVVGNVLDGFIDRLMSGVLGKSDEQDRANAAAAAAAGGGGGGGGNFGVPAGDGSLGSNWASLFATIKAIVPQARLNSGVRQSNDAHGRGKAVDFGFGTGPGGPGSAGLALIKRVLHDRFGKNLYELIYNGIGNDRPNLKNSRPLAYSAGIQAQHRNHVHAAVYDRGGLWEPGTAGFNFTNGVERVLTPPQDAYFRKFVDLTDRREQVRSAEPPVHLYTPDVDHAMRELRAREHEREALAWP